MRSPTILAGMTPSSADRVSRDPTVSHEWVLFALLLLLLLILLLVVRLLKGGIRCTGRSGVRGIRTAVRERRR